MSMRVHAYLDSAAFRYFFQKKRETPQQEDFRAGETRFTPAGKHAPENLSDQPSDLVLVELKGKAAAAPKAKTAPAE
jgi:hypothetical protein